MRYHRPKRSLKKLKAARRKLSAYKPYPRPGYGELRNLVGKTYQVQKNGEWRLVKDFNEKKPFNAAEIVKNELGLNKREPLNFEQSLITIPKARQL